MKKIKNLLITWHKGCTPTAMACILAYHADNYKGFGWDIPHRENELIEQLAIKMGTDFEGSTTLGNLCRGTESYLKEYDISCDVGIQYFSFYGPYKKEIDAKRPVYISLTGSTKYHAEDQTTGNHGVTGVGYQYDNSTDTEYVIIHDNWYTTPTKVWIDLESDEAGSSHHWVFVKK